MSNLPAKLQAIVEDFNYCEGQEKLEYLLEFAERLPDLPAHLAGQHDKMDEVHECMSPVFIFAEKDNGRVTYHFDIPPEAPTVRGFATILKEGLDGLSPDQILAIPNEFYFQMGLQHVLTGQRLNGIGAILAHMKTLAAEK
ncbi:MAG: SufE family protein [Anaerolineales bacterium]|nr:SufE family protein [Anaerolineales bacterium]